MHLVYSRCCADAPSAQFQASFIPPKGNSGPSKQSLPMPLSPSHLAATDLCPVCGFTCSGYLIYRESQWWDREPPVDSTPKPLPPGKSLGLLGGSYPPFPSPSAGPLPCGSPCHGLGDGIPGLGLSMEPLLAPQASCLISGSLNSRICLRYCLWPSSSL